MNRESLSIKKLILAHLQELMEDGERYGWQAVRAYHAVWLQYMEQGQTAWGDEETKLNLLRVLVWHRVVPVRYSGAPSQGHPHPWHQPTSTGAGSQRSFKARGQGVRWLQQRQMCIQCWTTRRFSMFAAIASTWCSACATTWNSTIAEKHS